MTFEETGEDLAANVASLGFDLKDLQARKMLRADHVHVDRSEIEETGEYDLEGLFICLGFAVDTIGAKRVVLDTIRALSSGFPNQAVLRSEIRRLFRWLKDKGVTTVITAERGDGTLTRQGLEEYVSDCVILLDNRVIDQITTCRLRTGADNYRWMLGRALPSRDEHGRPVQWIDTDIHEHKLALERID